MWCSVLVSFFFCLKLSTITHGSSLTRGFPSLEELRRNVSLLDRFSTHDGEIREVPGLTFNCPGQVQITKVTFIALPGPGEDDDDDEMDRPEIVIRIGTSTIGSFELEHEMLAFGQFGYESSVNKSVTLPQSDVGARLRITHPPLVDSTLRLLHQVGDEARNICWRYYADSNPQSLNCEQDFDYPLLAIETNPPGCIEGLTSAVELRRQWENRLLPVLYTSPEREISLNCPNSGSSTITQITVGAYQSMNGFNMQGPQITIYSDEDISQDCNVSTQPISEGVNVYECNIVDISVEDEITISVYQKDSVYQIGFLHDGEDDTLLIHIDGYCGSNQLLSAEELTEKTQNHILNITERVIEDTIEFPHLNITGDGQLVKWTFVARFAGMGQNYPQLSVLRQVLDPNNLFPVANNFIVENKNCTATVYPNVYECTVNQSVKAGDFVGLKLPAHSDAKLLLSFILNGAPPGMSLTGSGDGLVPGLPLISLEINPPVQRYTSSTHLFSSSINLLPSPTATGTMETTITDAGGGEGVIAAVGCSVSLLMIVIFTTSLILILLARKRKRNKSIDVIENTSYCIHHFEVRKDLNETELNRDVKPTGSHDDDTETLSIYGTVITDNPAYDTTLSGDVSTIVNDVTEVATTVNPAYDTTLSGDVSTTIVNDETAVTSEMATTVNPAYTNSTVISTDDNPAYVPTTRQESLVYDYARMQY